MKCACSFTPVLALVGLVGLGVGGYNMMSAGCPLGGCDESAAAASIVTTSDTKATDCCAGMEKVECETKTAGCESEKAGCESEKGAAVTTVANTEKAAEACASECSTKVCEDKLAKGECPYTVKTADNKEGCAMHPEADKVASKDKTPR